MKKWSLPALFLTSILAPMVAACSSDPSSDGEQAAAQEPLVIRASSNKAIVNFDSFSVEPGQTVKFEAPSPESLILVRVKGPEPVTVAGTLISNCPLKFEAKGGFKVESGATLDVPGMEGTRFPAGVPVVLNRQGSPVVPVQE